ncbi:hypothetical protein MICAC_1270004 [Microcystis aeruginosa PCC 9443]|uniref:Uncharacterized protein n=1 Tax=Microcystis aeruginosa PCC 9443 TaxID=1160281 RepID=I4FYP7_MICAE|nr:hypothetical protein MICAC_1270004 [Microcystis aeruginosa PCC 9443]
MLSFCKNHNSEKKGTLGNAIYKIESLHCDYIHYNPVRHGLCLKP